jgi:PAS domain S-box-containing protein
MWPQHTPASKSEEQFRALFETMAQGVIYQNAKGEIIAANPAALRILGLTLEQMQGGAVHDPRWRPMHEDGSPFPSETQPAMVALRTGQPVHNVVIGAYAPAEDGHRWISATAIPEFRAGETAPYRVYTTFEDITERKQAEELVYAQRDLARCIGTAGTVESGFGAILEIMLRLTGMDSGGIYLFSPDGQTWTWPTTRGLAPSLFRLLRAIPSTTPTSR